MGVSDTSATGTSESTGPADGVAVVPITDRIEAVRRALAAALRERIVGDDADAKHDEIVLAEGPRWFAADSAVVRVHTDASMLIGGMRALLLQSLHPLAMAGVARHSDYRNDPWGRLQRTADFLARTTFGTAETAERAVAGVRAVHARVHGIAADGRPYSASDPHLLRWVHVAEVDSFLEAHRAYGQHRLDDAGCDEYVAQMAVVARKLGVTAPPESVRGLRDQLRSFRHELHGTPESRDAARYLLLQPPLPVAARVPYSLIAAAAIATLPAWARRDLRLPWLPLTERFVMRPIGHGIAGAFRWAMSSDDSFSTTDGTSSPTPH